MKKVTAVILSVIMLLICSVISSNAADKPILQTDIVHGNPGEIVEVSLDLLNNPGITALSIDVDYPTNDLELTEVKGCGLFSDEISTGDIKNNPLRISWYASDSQNKTDNGTLAKLYFRILGNASLSRVNISYNPENVFNNALQNQTFSIKNGWVLAGDAKIGDTNGDGSVNISDATEVQKHLAQLLTLSGNRLKAADADGDGVVTLFGGTDSETQLEADDFGFAHPDYPADHLGIGSAYLAGDVMNILDNDSHTEDCTTMNQPPHNKKNTQSGGFKMSM